MFSTSRECLLLCLAVALNVVAFLRMDHNSDFRTTCCISFRNFLISSSQDALEAARSLLTSMLRRRGLSTHPCRVRRLCDLASQGSYEATFNVAGDLISY